MKIDETFLHTHPETAAWFDRRPQCETCAHLIASRGSMRCAQARDPRGARVFAFCIDARLDGAACGPDARLWVAA